MDNEIEKLEAELEEARKASAGARAAEDRMVRASELRAQIQAEKNAARDMPEIEKLDGVRGVDFDVVACRLGFVALKKPTPVQWKRFQTSKEDPRDAAEKLIRSCLAYPEAPAFTAILDDQPGALDQFAITCGALAGKDVERITGKS